MGTSTYLKRHLLPKQFLIASFFLLSFALHATGINHSYQTIDSNTDDCEVMGGMVFFDDDGDGCHHPLLEGYVPGVSVYLFTCSQQSPDISNAIAKDLTDATGQYQFGINETGAAQICLQSDETYYVLFELTASTDNDLNHYCFTQGSEVNCYNSESRDDVVDWTTGTTDCYDPTGTDDDDDILAGIVLCDNMLDLALIKEIMTPGPYAVGDLIEFEITVVHQEGAVATNIQIADHVPPGFSFDPTQNPGWTAINAPTYSYTITGPMSPGDTEKISIYLNINFLDDQSDSHYMNVAEIASASGIDGGPVTDMDSTPDWNPNNDGDAIDNSLDDKDDEDDHDYAQLPMLARFAPPCSVNCAVACIGQLNLSLGAECQATITPSMVLPDIESGCDDPANAVMFDIKLSDHYGEPISGNIVTAEHVGQLLQYSVDINNIGCENSCWGNILVESKLAPVLDCSLPVRTISCIELPTFEGPPLTGSGIYDPSTGSGVTGCFPTEVELEILKEQVIEVDDCEGDVIKKVIRQYQAVDVQGNRSNICTQELEVVKLETDSIKFPINSSQELQCNDDFFLIDTSIVLGLDVVPYYCPPMTGSGIPTTGSGTIAETIGDRFPVPLYPLPENVCNLFVDFEDEVIVDLPCKKQVLRTWNIRQWHCNEEFNEYSVQLVTLVDTEAPVLECPSDTIHVSTSGYDCTATVLLPEIGAVDSCQGEVGQIDMSHPGGFIEDQNGGTVSGIPIGLHPVTYTAYDACGNSSSCHVYVHVADERPPVVICESHTVVSIPITGEAHVPVDIFDDGSYDDCGQVHLKVRRMDLSCQKSETDSTSIEFGDYAVFCCEDVGDSHLVVLRATDHSGHYNECMTQVTVHDKNPPSLVAPPDITISCDYVFGDNNLSVFGTVVDSEFDRKPIVLEADSVNIEGTGFDGLALGSCGSVFFEDVNMGDINNCGIGQIVRTFSATKNGVTIEDVQTITVVSPVEFDSTRIIWPGPVVLEDVCDLSALHPDNLPDSLARPRIDDGICELLGISITDEKVFDPVRGGDACFKVFRTWSVIDWCDTDEYGIPARWDSTQILGVINTKAPIIDCDPIAEVYNSFDANCNPVMVSLSARAQDECTHTDELYWTWSIDLNKDGTIDTSGIGNSLTASYNPGLHEVTWYAEDLCGNVSLPCIQDFEITNEKAAPAICLDHVVTDLVLMDTDWDGAVDLEMVEVWATDVIKEDSHPCGHELSYSFDEAGLETNVVYGCDDIGKNSVRIYVTNLVNGAQSFCWTEIEVQDNNNIDLCGGVVHNPTSDGDVSGLILTESGSQVAEAEVRLLGSEIPNAKTDVTGMYAFNHMPMGGNYTVVPEKDLNYMNGVSTLDLVLIQKHILGLEILDSPYKIIAADINKSNTVTAADIVQLRKLILGEIDEYTNNKSWRFVDVEHEFTNPTNPWNSIIPEDYDIANLSEDMVVDFVGVKVGDVSDNAKGGELVRAETRTSKDPLKLNASVEVEGLNQVVSFSSTNFNEVNGYQLTIEFDAANYTFIGVQSESIEMSVDNVGTRYVERGMIAISWHANEGITLGKEDVLFKANFSSKGLTTDPISLSSSSAITVEEAYMGTEITDRVEITTHDEREFTTIQIKQNEPNPWRTSTVIGFSIPETGQVRLSLYDNTGQLINKSQNVFNSGYSEISIGRDIISKPGIYLYEIQYKDQILHKRMIVLD